MDEQNAYVDLAVYCHKCDKTCMVPDDVDIIILPKDSGGHHKASCKLCGSYIKFLGQNKALDKMPFGKYKGMAFARIADINPNYLKWLINQSDMKPKIKEAAELALFCNG